MKKIFLLLLLSTTFVFSQVFNLQGVLRLPTGKAATDGNYSFKFLIYDLPKGGIELANWNETQTIEVRNGIYNVLIGSKTPFAGLAFDRSYYIGISVNGGEEMAPRIQLTAAPYALSLQGTNNKVPNSGAVTFDKDVWHKSNDLVDRIKFDNNGATRVKSILVIENELEVNKNAGGLDLVGSDHVYLEFFPKGKAAGRKTWIGYGDATTKDLTISSEIVGGNINLTTTGAGTGVVASKVTAETVTANNLMYKVAEVRSDNFNANNIVISGLNGNLHNKYKVYFDLYIDAGGTDVIWNYIQFNGDGGSGRYLGENAEKFYGAGWHHDGNSAGTSIYMLRNGWGHTGYYAGEFTVFAVAGRPRSVYGEAAFLSFSNPAISIFSGVWKESDQNLISIKIGNIYNKNYGKGVITVYALP